MSLALRTLPSTKVLSSSEVGVSRVIRTISVASKEEYSSISSKSSWICSEGEVSMVNCSASCVRTVLTKVVPLVIVTPR